LSEEYDLKKSENKIGQLYPILKSKDGQIIDGFHRQKADPNWKSLVVPEIDSEEKLLLARLIANFHRRQITREEKEEWINGLAEIYKKQGLNVSPKNEILAKIVAVTGLNQSTVQLFMKSKYKQTEPEALQKHEPRVLASERIETTLGSEVAERFRKEVLEEATLSPKEKAKREAEKQRMKEERQQKQRENKRLKEEKLQKLAEERAKTLKAKELIKDKDFQREVLREIGKPQNVTSVNPCPSGICQAPSTIDAGKPLDIKAEQLMRFFAEHPQCICKKCIEYSGCAVIR
jgi:ParB-like chromosome segregation protein Spo0J